MFTFKNNFSSGELSPQVQGRTDLVGYKNGALSMENVIPRPQGGFVRRPGSVFVARSKYRDKTFRLIPFQYNIAQTYMLEVGEGYIRFHTQHARLEQTQTAITGTAAAAGLIRITSVAHGLTTNDYVAIRGVGGTTEANDDWKVTVIDADHFDLVGSTYTNAYTTGGFASKIIEIAAPWVEADLPDLRFSQDADVMFIVHPLYWPHLLARTSALVFTLTKIDNVVDTSEPRWLHGPFGALNPSSTHTMTWGGAVTVGTSNTMTSSEAYFVDDMIGMYFRFRGEVSGEQGYLRITAVGSTTPVTTATMKVESELSAAGASSNWALGAWGTYSGFPIDVAFFEGRLIFAGSALNPQTLWLSAIDAEYDFRVGTADNEPVTIPLRTMDMNAVRWVTAQQGILVGTHGGEFFITGGNDSAITPANKLVRQQSSFGGEPLRALRVGNAVLYTQRAGVRIRDLAYSVEQDKYISDDLSLLSNHILIDTPVVDWAFQLSPEPTVWLALLDGSMATLTIIKNQEVLSWARQTWPNGAVECVGVIPNDTFSTDDVWIGVLRLIGGTPTRYIEYLATDAVLDCSVSGTFGSPVTTISGLDHLNGQVVGVVGDAAPYDSQTVANGTVTISADEPALSSVQIGLAFTPTVVPMPPVFETPEGSSYGRKVRYTKVVVHAVNTLTMAVNGVQAPSRTPGDDMDTPVPASDEALFQFTTLGNQELGRLVLTQPLPLAWEVRGIFGECTIGK